MLISSLQKCLDLMHVLKTVIKKNKLKKKVEQITSQCSCFFFLSP